MGPDRFAERVLLWADTFNNFFHPETAQAAVEVLEHLGYDVFIQREHLCCGRPLYDYGMRVALEVDVLDDGCCGMAGSFGFEKGKYDISMNIAERKYLPAARRAALPTLFVADGFSCREQARRGAGRRAMHVAEVVRLALQQSHAVPAVRLRPRHRYALGTGILAAAAVVGVRAYARAAG